VEQIITLLSDFGGSDGYLAAMKGVILDLSPRATLVDAGHDLPRPKPEIRNLKPET
jgi:hypothetical protein